MYKHSDNDSGKLLKFTFLNSLCIQWVLTGPCRHADDIYGKWY